ncbi:4-hydroxybenzoate octaprenyltransferase [Desulfobaculum bizertense]|uniref:4-hydroxybenzoate polyprenyltransferase n=1 Tax=Desulfobaculum bizertense DSM 18034 TaxID=1121442 RepID=A0A1T4WTM5_9BACT|nr:4-hydroxybenzoate octaprenyltransferase [Desulfobaculum bizertense]UIJ37249.1 putative 4-hydroxybenzoate polyprenyltransferase [Desulfobaculum bizertense]SKA80215.1 4-hydroxybenzoate polyprenyltransferase [Desulfobaculum bizertense DSM 18034]
MKKFLALCRMVKIEHSIFALPFAFTGTFLAAKGWPGFRVFLLLTIGMVAIRSFAMGFNRLADLKIDAKNPRTQKRPLVTGEISIKETALFLTGTAIIFVLACAGMNTLCLKLSPIALFVCAGYSYTKRFTYLCHYWLGAVLGLAPIAGWLAYDPTFTLSAILFFFGVTFWVAGFDILYSCQDIAFDRANKLNSIPAHFGLATALTLSSFSHIMTSIFFLLAGWAAQVGVWFYPVWAVVALILVFEHLLISEDDMSRVNVAFFTLNGVISVIFFLGVLASIYY